MSSQPFIPATSPRSVGDGIFFRPIKSWHSATYAGEGLYEIPGSGDGSGCVWKEYEPRKMCTAPLSVTHRVYWHESNPDKTISAFLSYPGGIAYNGDKYFWEIYGPGIEDVERFDGEKAESEMEERIKAAFRKEAV